MTLQESGMTLDEFKDFIAGKSIAIVGNSLDSLSTVQGELIDSHDLILRFGRGTPRPEIFERIGTNTHIWVTGALRADRRSALPVSTVTLWNNSLFSGQGVPVREPCLEMYSQAEIEEVRLKYNNRNDKRLSAGAITAHWLANVANTWESLTFYNFDCFTQHSNIYNHIAGHNSQVSSWHLPLLKKEHAVHNWDHNDGNPAHDTPAEIAIYKDVLKKVGTVWKGKPLVEEHSFLDAPTVEWTSGRVIPRY